MLVHSNSIPFQVDGLEAYKKDSGEILPTYWTSWPLIHTLQFTVVPKELRISFVATMSFVWLVYLSYASRGMLDERGVDSLDTAPASGAASSSSSSASSSSSLSSSDNLEATEAGNVGNGNMEGGGGSGSSAQFSANRLKESVNGTLKYCGQCYGGFFHGAGKFCSSVVSNRPDADA